MSFQGPLVQNAIYIGQTEHAWPLTAEGWEERAREAMSEGAFGYIAGGAGSESTMRANLEAFDRYRLRPKMLRGNLERDLAVEILGTPSQLPFLLGPVGVLSIAHPDASWVGIGLAAFTAPTMPLLAAAKRRAGRRVGSRATVSEAGQNLICAYLSVALLVGLLLNAIAGWWWADPAAALVIAAVAAKEGVEAWRGEDDCC